MDKDNDIIYDEKDAVKFIRNFLPQEAKEKFTDGDIRTIIDLIYDYYESKGFFNEDDDAVVNIDEEELTDYVAQKAHQTDPKFTPDEVTFIIQGEMDYCDSIHMFES